MHIKYIIIYLTKENGNAHLTQIKSIITLIQFTTITFNPH